MMSNKIKIVKITKEDYESLVEYLANFLDDDRESEFWRDRLYHWWDNNPYFKEDDNRGWALKKNEDIVGFLGNIPMPFYITKNEIVANTMTNWKVAENYRSKSINLIYELIAASRDTLLCNSTSNENVAKILDLFRFEKKQFYKKKMYFSVINPNKIAKKKLSNAKVLKKLESILTSIFYLMQYANRGILYFSSHKKVKRISKADNTFDNLWDETKNSFSNTIVRDSIFLNWYCFGNKFKSNNLLGFYENNELLGFMVLKWASSVKDELKVIECIDLWVKNNKKYVIKSLLFSANKLSKDLNADLFVTPVFNEQLFHVLKRSFYFKLPNQNSNSIYIKSDLEAYKLGNNKLPYITNLVGDYDL